MSAPTSPTSTTSSARFRRNTGFPEPFCTSRNTTLPHPDAIISPDASISSEDVDPARTSRRSILAKKHRYRHTLAHGKIPAGASSESLGGGSSSAAGGGGGGGAAGEDEDETPPGVFVLMMPDGRISKDLSLEEARRSYDTSRTDEERGKRSLIKRMLGQ